MMKVDISTVVVAALTGATSSAIVLFAAKKLLEGLIDSRIRRADDAYSADLAERMRRRAELFDRQADAMDELTAAVYQIRNAAREFVAHDALAASLAATERTLQLLTEDFRERLTVRRSVLPTIVFGALHSVRTPLRSLLLDLDRLKNASGQDRNDIQRSIENEVRHINVLYESVVSIVHSYRGVKNDPMP